MKKALVVFLLFATGIGGAMLFRKPAGVVSVAGKFSPALPPRSPSTHRPLRDIKPSTPPVQGVPAAPPKTPRSDLLQSQPQRPAVLQPGARPPLPQLSEFDKENRESQGRASSAKSTSNRSVPSKGKKSAGSPGAKTDRLHTIVDGDTLERIARRYLGDALWADAIYRMNQTVITDRGRLPLGEKIRIPPPEQLSNTNQPLSSAESNLVPLPNWIRRKTK